MPEGQNGKDWEKHKLHIIEEIKRLDSNQKEVWDKIDDVSAEDIPKLKESITLQISDLKDFLNKKFESINKELNKKFETINKELLTLKIKSGLWGMAAGMIPALMVILMFFIRSNLK